jgi:hypothetical protein
MNRSRIDRLEKVFAPSEPERRPIPMPTDTRQMLLDSLPELCSEAFGPSDQRADQAYLATLDLRGLIALWEQTHLALGALKDSPEWQAFDRLPLEEQIRFVSDPQPIALSLERLLR